MTKIFLDGGDPEETKQMISLLGSLDGQTTNPTLVAKTPGVIQRLENGQKFSKEEIFNYYKKLAQEISDLIPQGSVSLEVYADQNTTSEEMFKMGKEMFEWIPTNAHIKYPTTAAGLEAAQRSVKEGMRVNMTLCFSQSQAAAVYAATYGASKGQVFVSPFIGRLDDIGLNGLDLIRNIIQMYKSGDGHVEVLAASIRNLDHLLESIKLSSDILTAPFKTLKEWADTGKRMPDESFTYQTDLNPIPYENIDLGKEWQDFDIKHKLTDKGIEKFAADWNALLA